MPPRPVVDLVVSWPDDPQTTVQLWHHHGSQEASSMVRVTGDSHCFPGIAPKGLHPGTEPQPPCIHTKEVVEVTYTLVLFWHF